MDIIKELYDMKETVGQKIADANKKLHKAGGAMDMSDIEIVDKLAHTMKSLVSTCAMLEAEDGEYSETGPLYYPVDAERCGMMGTAGTVAGITAVTAETDTAAGAGTDTAPGRRT